MWYEHQPETDQHAAYNKYSATEWTSWLLGCLIPSAYEYEDNTLHVLPEPFRIYGAQTVKEEQLQPFQNYSNNACKPADLINSFFKQGTYPKHS